MHNKIYIYANTQHNGDFGNYILAEENISSFCVISIFSLLHKMCVLFTCTLKKCVNLLVNVF